MPHESVSADLSALSPCQACGQSATARILLRQLRVDLCGHCREDLVWLLGDFSTPDPPCAPVDG